MLDPVNTVREYSLLTNPRMPPSVTGSVHHTSIDWSSAKPGAEVERLAARTEKVINVTSLFVGDSRRDLTSAESSVLTKKHKRKFRSKFGWVAGSWCCAPNDEMKQGAPRSAHFSLMNA